MSRFFGKDSQYLVGQKKRHKYLFLLVFLVTFILSLLIIFFSFLYRKFLYITYPLFGLSLIGFILYLKLLRSERRLVFSFAKGAKGEKNIVELLRQFPDDFLVFQDIKLEENSGNIDFVVVGKKGVYAIEVKSHKGNITYDNGQLLLDGKPFEKDIIGQTMREAMDLHGFLLAKLSKDIFVYPVLVFSNWKVQVKFNFNPIKHVYIVLYGELKDLLFKLESESHHSLNQEELRQVLHLLLQSNESG